MTVAATRRQRGQASRIFTELTTPAVHHALESLIRQEGTKAYGKALTDVGRGLGQAIISKVGPLRKAFALVSTPEDADFLTQGMLEALPKHLARLVCYWTDRRSFDDGDVATVVQEFNDPRITKQVDTVIVAKTIISSSCVARTNLEHFLQRTEPARIVIAAPVMFSGAEARLKSAFAPELSARFEFVTFAIDSQTNGSTIVPGVGGMVEKRLGLQSQSPRFLPSLVKTWAHDFSVP